MRMSFAPDQWTNASVERETTLIFLITIIIISALSFPAYLTAEAIVWPASRYPCFRTSTTFPLTYPNPNEVHRFDELLFSIAFLFFYYTGYKLDEGQILVVLM